MKLYLYDTVMKKHHTLCATSAQFTTAKIQSCAKVSSNSSRSDIRKYAAGLADTQGWQLDTCKLHKNWECAWSTRKLSYFIMWLLYLQLLREKKRYGLVWAVRINPPELTVNDEARNEAHIASTGVQLH